MFAFRVLHTVPYSNQPAAGDLIAKLHSFITSNLLVGCALIISFRQFGGKPIDCMVPTDFTPSWTQYAEMYCWAQESYFVPFSSIVAGLTDEDKAEKKVSYYQWMPFFLLFEAMCFNLPCLIWKYFASQSGMRIGEIIRISASDSNGVPDVKKSNVEALGIHLNGALRFHKALNKKKLVPHKLLRFLNVKYTTYYVTLIYFLAKIAFLLNVVLQIHLLERYVLPQSTDEHLAFKTWKMLINGNDTWSTENGIFPRVTLCDFETRDMGNVQNHTVQCLLLMNVFTEKTFLVLWTWYLLLASFTALNVLSWLWMMYSETSQLHFILAHLEMSETVPMPKGKEDRQKAVENFIQYYLGSDGMLVLHLVAQHADVVFTTELVANLWASFVNVEQQRQALKRMNEFVAHQKSSAFFTPAIMDEVDGLEGGSSGRLRRAVSIDGGMNEETKKFDESSSDEESSSSKKKSAKNSREATPKGSRGTSRRGTLEHTNF